MAYTADGAIVLVPQRAILDASNATVVLTLAAPGGAMIGKIIAAIASDVSNTASITYEDSEGTKTHTFTEAGECVWFYGSTIDAWMKMGEPTITLGTYGDGRDGDELISSNSTFSDNKFFDNLTLDSAVGIQVGNVVVCVKDTLTMFADSYFRAYPDDASEGASGGAKGSGLAGRWYGTSGSGGNGGVDSANGDPGDNVSSSLGGNGGAGGDGETGGTGGAAGVATAPAYLPYFLEAILHGKDRNATSFTGGAGGGGGGSEKAGTTGGGGGGGGGIICIVAKKLVFDTRGTALPFNARGGNAGDAGSGQNGSGGGGGGGGGFVCLIYQSAFDETETELTETELQSMIDVGGGSKGLGILNGLDGLNGSPGNSLILKHG